MSTPKKWSRALLVGGGALVVVVAAAVIKRDAIAGLILKGGDISLQAASSGRSEDPCWRPATPVIEAGV